MAALPYIQLYVADYLADTAHLTAAQHGAYLLLLMNYWQRGKALNNSNERLANVARMSSDEWLKNKADIEEFFEVNGDEWVHRRIERDLAAVADKTDKAKSAGRASANKRSTPVEQSRSEHSTDVQRTFNGRSTDAEQTLNHLDPDKDTEEEQQLTSFVVGAQARSPTTGNVSDHPTRRAKRAATTTLGVADLEAEGVDRQLAADWLRVRKEKRAPLTQTAWDIIKTEAFKAGMTLNEALRLCIAKSWQGFKASWVENERRCNGGRPPSRHDISAVNYGQGGAL